MSEQFDTVVIGAGQAGLSAGHYLARRKHSYVILDAASEVGGSWANRWDSMRVFTPATHDGLPGKPYPGGFGFPTRDEMVRYLRGYATSQNLAIRSGVRVDGLFREGDEFLVTAGDATYRGANVVIATGYHRKPRVPDFAGELSPDIVSMHSADYRNPAQLRPGAVLLVGAGNSGADIALDVVAAHRTILAGRHPGHLPINIESGFARMLFPLIWFSWGHVLTVHTPPGRKVQAKMLAGHGDMLIRIKPAQLDAAGVERAPRITGVVDGRPVTEDGTVLDVANVIWCTGFERDYGWIDIDGLDASGRLPADRAAVSGVPGLFVLGQEFQYAFNSHTIGGVARDAEWAVGQIAKRMKRRRAAASDLAAAGA